MSDFKKDQPVFEDDEYMKFFEEHKDEAEEFAQAYMARYHHHEALAKSAKEAAEYHEKRASEYSELAKQHSLLAKKLNLESEMETLSAERSRTVGMAKFVKTFFPSVYEKMEEDAQQDPEFEAGLKLIEKEFEENGF